MVVSLRVAARPPFRTCLPSSDTLQRERGAPARLGNSQARALTCTTSSGGKSPGAPRALAVFQTRQTLLKEALSPQADDLASGAEVFSDLIVGEALMSQKNHLGTDNHKIRQRILIGASEQFLPLIPRETDLVWAPARQRQSPPGEAYQERLCVANYTLVYL